MMFENAVRADLEVTGLRLAFQVKNDFTCDRVAWSECKMLVSSMSVDFNGDVAVR